MLVRDWMTRDVVTVTPDTSLMNARRLLDTYEIRHLPVVEHGRVVGMVSDRNLRTSDPALRSALDTLRSDLAEGRFRPVASLMSAPARTVAPTDTLASASALMMAERIGAVPVVAGGRIVGILSLVDCLRAYLAAEREQERRAVGHPAPEDDPDRWVHIPMPPGRPRPGRSRRPRPVAPAPPREQPTEAADGTAPTRKAG